MWKCNSEEVWPLDDLKEHIIGNECWCNPWKTETNLLIHVSLDKRENLEEDSRKRPLQS